MMDRVAATGGETAAEELIPLTPALFHVLLVLSAGPTHGYAIMQEVEALTDGQMRLGAGTLYRTLERAITDGLLAEQPDSSGDERRRVYRLTRLGLATARAEARRLATLTRAAAARGLLPASAGRVSPRSSGAKR